MPEKTARVTNGKIGLSLIPSGINLDTINEGINNKFLTSEEKTKLSNIDFGDSVPDQINTAVASERLVAPFIKNSSGTQVTIYFQTQEPTNWKENDLWVVPVQE